ncbi:TIGR02186 family protein [Chthonobacter rhizosphaerae]|uniref:TIGR02186 family protein n=1 Tax=Chthonobacter rhizosphaerae TaxID=2735553 RepID=UPI0015EFCA9C|nr:TIGR02186 family protein [Chthonobacter rhizosphaerae]
MAGLARVVAVAAVLIAALALPARADKLVTALSNDRVSITSNFTGGQVVVFGTVERDSQSVSRPENHEVVVTLAGPLTNMVTRRKERTFGIWINRESERIRMVPSFLAIRSARPIEEVATEAVRARLGLGLDMFPINAQTSLSPPARTEFETAFIRLMQENGRYSQMDGAVEFLGADLFRAPIALPANVPVGTYTARVYLFRAGVLLSSTEDELVIGKVGFEQYMTVYAHNHGVIYGFATVLVACLTGWLAGILFRRD